MLKQSSTLYAFETDRFESVERLTCVPEEPTPDADNPILGPGGPGEPDEAMTQFLGSIVKADDTWMMYYCGRSSDGLLSPCLATSTDGLTWTRHGLVQGVPRTSECTSVLVHDGRFIIPVKDDRRLRPEEAGCETHRRMVEREIAVTRRTGVPVLNTLATSDDGRTFRAIERETPMLTMKFEVPRIVHFQGRFVMNGQTNGPWVGCGPSRVTAFYTSGDLEHWQLEPVVFENRSWNRQTHCGIAPIKQVDQRLLIGLGGRFDDAAEIPDQHFDITLLYSYDGLAWRPVCPELERRSWIRRGRPGEWDFGGVEQGQGLVERGDDAWVYYGGSGVGNLPTGSWIPGTGAIGRVHLKRDRFAFLRPTIGWGFFKNTEPFSGSLTTGPLVRSDRELSLNVLLPERAESARVEVDLLDPRSNEVIGSGTVTRPGVRSTVELSADAPGREVKLRLRLIGGPKPDQVPKLYAIEY